MTTTLLTMAGLLVGYTFGYVWKGLNPNEEKYDLLVFVLYPSLAMCFVLLAIFLTN